MRLINQLQKEEQSNARINTGAGTQFTCVFGHGLFPLSSASLEKLKNKNN